jgi:hypothetical protein
MAAAASSQAEQVGYDGMDDCQMDLCLRGRHGIKFATTRSYVIAGAQGSQVANKVPIQTCRFPAVSKSMALTLQVDCMHGRPDFCDLGSSTHHALYGVTLLIYCLQV